MKSFVLLAFLPLIKLAVTKLATLSQSLCKKWPAISRQVTILNPRLIVPSSVQGNIGNEHLMCQRNYTHTQSMRHGTRNTFGVSIILAPASYLGIMRRAACS